MNGALQIAVDLEQGEIRLGSERVRLLPVAGDVFCLNDARGPLVRALKFEERSQLLGGAGDEDVASRIAEAALVSSGVAVDDVRVAASLALAGGGEEAPSFPECVRFVEQQYGWDEKRVGETMALVIDRLCSQMAHQDANGWKQIVFQKSDADLGTLISQMATNLSQRAVAGQKTNTEPGKPQTSKQQQSPSTRQSTASNNSNFAPQHPSSPSHGSMQSVSSVLPVKSAPFRVLGVNTDPAHAETAVVVAASAAAASTQAETAATIISKLQQVETPQPMPRQSLMATALPTAPEPADFATTPQLQTTHANFSLSQPAAALTPSESITALPPVAAFPAWQPFATSSTNTQGPSENLHTNSKTFGVAATEPQAVHDWLAELAQLLEAECDLRGIDP